MLTKSETDSRGRINSLWLLLRNNMASTISFLRRCPRFDKRIFIDEKGHCTDTSVTAKLLGQTFVLNFLIVSGKYIPMMPMFPR